MHLRLIRFAALSTLFLSIVSVKPVSAHDSKKVAPKATAMPQKPQQAIDKALDFLIKDAAKWRKERGCATCHHGTMTAWALSEARTQGYAVDAETLADMVQWTKNQFMERFTKPRDPRPGWNLVGVPAIYLGVMSQSLPILSRDEINQIAVHLARHQEVDGTWEMPPPKNGAPPTWESRETLALWAVLAWEPYMPKDPKEATAARVSREKAVAWLNQTKSTDTTQAAALRFLLDVRTGKSPSQLGSALDRLLRAQKADGGWNQTGDLPSDAYATGQALWALSFAGVKNDRPEIARAVSFLVANQREEGSWPMIPRNHPEVKATRDPVRSLVPITYFGSAWATLGLVRSVPSAPDTAPKQQRAFDSIKALSGKYKVDEKRPGKPVIHVEIGYDMADTHLAELAANLTAFPQLETLHLKSSKITDAGLMHLKVLSQIRDLALENAAITDAGLTHLKALSYLENLNLKGTKITDAGNQDFQKALPKVKVVR